MKFDRSKEYSHIILTRFHSYLHFYLLEQGEITIRHICILKNESRKISKEIEIVHPSDEDIIEQLEDEIHTINKDLIQSILNFTFTNSWRIFDNCVEELFNENSIDQELKRRWIKQKNIINPIKKIEAFLKDENTSNYKENIQILRDFYER